MRLDDFEKSTSEQSAQTVTVDGFTFTVRRLPVMLHDAAIRVGRARAKVEDLPEGLDSTIPEHAETWAMVCLTQEVTVAALASWPLKDDLTPDNVRRFVRLAPERITNAIYAAASPKVTFSENSGESEGND